MGLRPQERERGLAALNDARRTRRKAVVMGRAKIRDVATAFWLVTFAGLVIFGFAYWRYSLAELEARRGELSARQRAVAAAVGPGGFELRDRLEAWTVALAHGSVPARIDPSARVDDITAGPAIYLRLLESEAQDPEAIRRGAMQSRRDGFTSCMFAGRPTGPARPACEATYQCGAGEVCDDWGVCSPPAHPYNARMLYRGLRVLLPEWRSALEATTNKMQVRAIELDLLEVAKHEVVATHEMVRQARYFTLVLDALPTGAPGRLEASPNESLGEAVQAVDHPVRVGIWDINRGAAIAVANLQAAGRFVRMGGRGDIAPEALEAQQRQANNCAIATQLRELIQAAAESAG